MPRADLAVPPVGARRPRARSRARPIVLASLLAALALPGCGQEQPSATAPAPAPVEATASPHDAERANAYDDAWQDAWVAHARAVAGSGEGKTPGFVLQVGDSITHAAPYAAWPYRGAGWTGSDRALLAWIHADAWGDGERDPTCRNGFYLAVAEITRLRGFTAVDGIDTAEFLSGRGNGPGAMPAIEDPASALATLADPAASFGNCRIETLAAAFGEAQAAVLMLGTNDVTRGRAPAEFAEGLARIVDVLEGAGIVVVLSTIPPYPSPAAGALVERCNERIRDLARERALALIDFHAEILARRPGDTWHGTLLPELDVHPSAAGGGYHAASDPYAAGGDPERHATGAACDHVGYLLRSWLTVQKLKEVKAAVFE